MLHQAALMPRAHPHQSGGEAGLAWVEGVRLLGIRVTAVAAIDAAEHDRRLAAGCGAVTDPVLLDRLLALLLGTPVRDPVAWVETADQPAGVIERDADGMSVTRHLAPPRHSKA